MTDSVRGFNHYRFRSVWVVEASTDDVFEVLRDVSSYPKWWPEIKEAHRLGSEQFALRVRSLLPYYLDFELARSLEDMRSGVLEARLSGDLDGFSRWTVEEAARVTRAIFDEEVVTHKRSLNVLAPLARPAFRANHTFMMRHGEAGLRTFVAGMGFRPHRA